MLVVGVSGCVAAAPPRATPTPVHSTVIATPEPVTQSLVIGPTSFTIMDSDGTEHAPVSYSSDADAAVNALVAAIGSSPVDTTIPTSSCSFEFTRHQWPGFRLDSAGVSPFQGNASFVLYATSPTTGALASVRTPQGYAVGESAAGVAKEAGVVTMTGGSTTFYYFSLTEVPAGSGRSGLSAEAGPSGTITALRSPALADDDYC